MWKQTFLASFRILIHPYSCLQQNKILIRYNININQAIYNLNKNNIDDKFVQETIHNLYYLQYHIFYFSNYEGFDECMYGTSGVQYLQRG